MIEVKRQNVLMQYKQVSGNTIAPNLADRNQPSSHEANLQKPVIYSQSTFLQAHRTCQGEEAVMMNNAFLLVIPSAQPSTRL